MLLSENIPAVGTQIVATCEGNVLLGTVAFVTPNLVVSLQSNISPIVAFSLYASDGWQWSPVPDTLNWVAREATEA